MPVTILGTEAHTEAKIFAFTELIFYLGRERQ